jgi:hypothetical protein
MSLDEEFEEGIWYGADFALNESQELVYIGSDYPRDDTAQEDGPEPSQEMTAGGSYAVTQESIPTEFPTAAVPMESSTAPTDSQEEDVDNVHVKHRAKRNKTSYAKKMILGKLDLFLDPMYDGRFTDESVEIVGQVKECPREANGKRYRLEWKNAGKALPAGLERTWLCTYLPGTKQNREKLQLAILAYNSSGKRPEKSVRVTGLQSTGSRSRPQSVPVDYVDAAVAASASVRTSSTISSLSQNSIASPKVPPSSRRGTRSSLTVESSSDDGDDLDEEDNIYAADYFRERDYIY